MLLQAFEGPLDYLELIARSRDTDDAPCPVNVRAAILSDAATQQLVPLLKFLFKDQGLNCEFYEGVFDGFELEVYDVASRLYRFEPDTIVLLHSVQALVDRYYRRPGNGAEFLETEISRIQQIIDTIRTHSPAAILVSNLVMPYERFFGNYDHRSPDSLYFIVSELNRRIGACAAERSGVLLNDLESVASWRGRRHWFDDRFWCLSKAFCSPEQLPYVAKNIVDIVQSIHGRSVKCIALDLDNTLWGGVVADDGIDGIRISADGDGEAFYRFQRYLLELKKRGILLAVCSKNEFENAILPFREHPDMVIREHDFAVFIANWNDKAENLKALQRSLNIGLDSIVFLDDNAFERNLVRHLLPGIIVPEMPDDPAEYVNALSELNLFDSVSFSQEDTRRSELYVTEARRQLERGNFSTIDEYLSSLEMRLTIAPFDDAHLQRITQLLQRSNQFNLTSNRYNEAQCRQMMGDENYLPLYGKLSDRFGDYGLISIVILRFMTEGVAITDWLMSCRVLCRGVEQELMNDVFRIARQHGGSMVTGRYVPTVKNAVVRDFYGRFGFRMVSELPSAETHWALQVKDYQPQNVFLTRV